MNDLPRNEQARRLWARTKVHLWPERYCLVSLDPRQAADAARLLAAHPKPFAALVREKGEVSLTIAEGLWRRSRLRPRALGESAPLRVITFDLVLEHDVVGYLAPATARLARASVSVVPQCTYHKDHLLVPAEGVRTALRVLRGLIRDCRRVRTTGSRGKAGRKPPRARG